LWPAAQARDLRVLRLDACAPNKLGFDQYCYAIPWGFAWQIIGAVGWKSCCRASDVEAPVETMWRSHTEAADAACLVLGQFVTGDQPCIPVCVTVPGLATHLQVWRTGWADSCGAVGASCWERLWWALAAARAPPVVRGVLVPVAFTRAAAEAQEVCSPASPAGRWRRGRGRVCQRHWHGLRRWWGVRARLRRQRELQRR
jgi:hypothetical protein